MPIVSPFLTLDEERKARNKELMNKLGSFGGSLVQTPLTYQSLLQEQEDRKRKIEADAEELARKRAEESREVEKFDREGAEHKQRLEEGEFNLGAKKSKATKEKIDSATSDLVAGMIAEGASDQEILERSFGHPDLEEVTDQSVIEGEIARQRQALSEQESKTGLKERELDIKQQLADARKKDAETRANRAVAKSRATRPKPIRFVGEAAMKRLEDLDIRLDDMARIRSFMDAEEMGLASGLINVLKRRVKMDSPKEALFSVEVNRYLNEELHRLGGATLTDQEFARISRGLPATYDYADVFEALIAASESKLNNDYNKILKTQQMGGRDTSGFETKKTPEQIKADKEKTVAEALKTIAESYKD